jgi:hypothetical protein
LLIKNSLASVLDRFGTFWSLFKRAQNKQLTQHFPYICNGWSPQFSKEPEPFKASLLTLFKVHADASNFASGVTKEEAYKQILEHAEALFEGQRNWVSFHFPSLSLQIQQRLTIHFPGLVRTPSRDQMIPLLRFASIAISQIQRLYYGMHINPYLLHPRK